MENQVPDILSTVAGVSPFVGLLGWLFWKEREERKEGKTELKNLNEKVMEAFEENIKTSESLKQAVENNTEATRNLTQSVYLALGGGREKR